MKNKTRTEPRITNREILYSVDGYFWKDDTEIRHLHYATPARINMKRLTVKRLVTACDECGRNAMQLAAKCGKYPRGMKFEHLVRAEKYMNLSKPSRPDDNLMPSLWRTPLETAIRNGNFPVGTTKAKLEQASTRCGTGWDMIKKCVRMKVHASWWKNDEKRFSSARKILLKFPELLACLNPLKRQFDAEILSQPWFSHLPRRVAARNEPAMLWLLQVRTGEALVCIGYLKPTEQIRLVRLCLLGPLPAIRGVKQQTCEAQLANAKNLATFVLEHPELASVLRPEIVFHAQILDCISTSPLLSTLTLDQRKILSQHPTICAALL